MAEQGDFMKGNAVIRNFRTFIVIACLAGCVASAHAAELTLSGNTTGTVTGVTPLTFTGNVFTGTTALNIGSLSGTNSLGTFSLGTAPISLLSGSFTLNLTFTAPTGIAGGQAATYNASITGSVSPNVDQGGVLIDFGSPQTFTFSNGLGSGSFTLTIADLFVQTGRSANVTAGFTGPFSPVPEPATLALLSIGLVGVALKLRRRSA
jgi:hypothetical protein